MNTEQASGAKCIQNGIRAKWLNKIQRNLGPVSIQSIRFHFNPIVPKWKQTVFSEQSIFMGNNNFLFSFDLLNHELRNWL